MAEYKNPPLDKVVLRIDFEKISGFDVRYDAIDAVYDKIVATNDKFRVYNNKKINIVRGLEVVLNEATQGLNSIEKRNYQFFDNNERCLTLADEFISFEANKHPGFHKVILPDLLMVWHAINTENDIQIKRVGLRYINKIRFSDDKELKTLLKPYLHANIKFENEISKQKKFKLKTVQQLSRTTFKCDETGVFVNCTYGVPERYQGANNFILDIDSWAVRTTNDINLDTCIEQIHDQIINIFEHSITNILQDKIA